MAYIFANGVLLTPACALIIFAGTVIYPSYDHVNVLGENLPAIHDQQLGGTLMKVLQELVYGWILAHVFFKWYHTERKKDEDDEEAELSNRLNGSSMVSH
jgi:putative membrane protein